MILDAIKRIRELERRVEQLEKRFGAPAPNQKPARKRTPKSNKADES